MTYTKFPAAIGGHPASVGGHPATVGGHPSSIGGWPLGWIPTGFGASLRAWYPLGGPYDLGASGITRWHDAGGLDIDATQSGGPTEQPTISAINGRQAIRFTAANSQFLIADALAAHHTGEDKAFTLAYVGQLVSSTGTVASFGHTTTNPNVNWQHPSGSGSGKYRHTRRSDAGGADIYNIETTVAVDTDPHAVVWRCPGTTLFCYLDTAVTSVNGTAANVGTITLSRFSLGVARLGAGNFTFFDGLIGEFLFWSADIGETAVLTNVLPNLRARFGL